MLVACDAADPSDDAGTGGVDAGSCAVPPAAGFAFTFVSGEWMTGLDGREVFRLHLVQHDDPLPTAVDDETRLTALIDIAPHRLLELDGQALEIDQQISSSNGGGFDVSSGPRHDSAIRRVLIDRSAGIAQGPGAGSYRVTGELALRMTLARRVTGHLSLTVDGQIPQALVRSSHMPFSGCFDFTATGPTDCQPGMECGQDCPAVEEWPCWDCGSLYLTHECECRPDLAPLEECSAGAAPGEEGEPCGEQWWCERPCASGLVCSPAAADDLGADDAGVANLCEHRTTCQLPR